MIYFKFTTRFIYLRFSRTNLKFYDNAPLNTEGKRVFFYPKTRVYAFLPNQSDHPVVATFSHATEEVSGG